jgi:pilus assembly protein Flp/PilA
MRALTRDDRGQDLIEYALLAGLIALGSVALITAAGGSVETIWTSIRDALAVAAAGI